LERVWCKKGPRIKSRPRLHDREQEASDASFVAKADALCQYYTLGAAQQVAEFFALGATSASNETRLSGEARELDVDEACDYVYAAIRRLIDIAAEGANLDSEKLSFDWSRKLLIELGDDWVAFSFRDDSASIQ
jgi:hypothetical protein